MKKNLLRASTPPKKIPQYACSIVWILVLILMLVMTWIYVKLAISIINGIFY